MLRRPILACLALACLGGCAAGSANAVPGAVASRAPFDATTLTARYVDRCMKDGGTQGRCQCEVADVAARLGQDGLERVVKGMETGGPAATQALEERRPAMTACGWPNTKL
jgi:hypothetical protein